MMMMMMTATTKATGFNIHLPLHHMQTSLAAFVFLHPRTLAHKTPGG